MTIPLVSANDEAGKEYLKEADEASKQVEPGAGCAGTRWRWPPSG
jgi:hypothetical protein